MVRSKNDAQLTAHMPRAYLQAIQNSLVDNQTASEWLREAAIEKLNKQLLQAKNTVAALKVIESDELYQSYESRQSYESYRSYDDEL